MRHNLIPVALFSSAFLAVPAARAISIQFDYTYDTSGFFNDPARRSTLQLVADSLPMQDALASIQPSATDSWDATFVNPSTGAPAAVHNLAVGQDTLVIYVGARPLPSGAPGDSHPGSAAAATGSPGFLAAVATRGQSGATDDPATSTDFGPWGGSISFNASTDWDFDVRPPAVDNGQTFFASAAMHELFHVLGFGTAPSFLHHVSGDTFTGPTAIDRYYPHTPVPLTPDHLHWDSPFAGAMVPNPPSGRFPGATDYAALRDLGWDAYVPGEPHHGGDVGEGIIDLNDLNFVLNNFGGYNPLGDYDEDGYVDLVDLNYVLNNFGPSLSATQTLPIVPEPTAFIVPSAALALLARRARRCNERPNGSDN